MKQKHNIPPVYDSESHILILGSFPSVKSREEGFFYGHKQNRFWRVLSALLCEPLPLTVNEKKAMLHKHHIALWDVIASCEISGSSDNSIKAVIPNDIQVILKECLNIKIFVNGKTAERYYKKYMLKATGREALTLPSTSPANAAWSFERLLEAWSIILDSNGGKE